MWRSPGSPARLPAWHGSSSPSQTAPASCSSLPAHSAHALFDEQQFGAAVRCRGEAIYPSACVRVCVLGGGGTAHGCMSPPCTDWSMHHRIGWPLHINARHQRTSVVIVQPLPKTWPEPRVCMQQHHRRARRQQQELAQQSFIRASHSIVEDWHSLAIIIYRILHNDNVCLLRYVHVGACCHVGAGRAGHCAIVDSHIDTCKPAIAVH
jgi:hypothetical protein